jgi:hypothetical protein
MINNARNEATIEENCAGITPHAGVVLAVAVTVEAQQPKKVPRIGRLTADSTTANGLSTAR